MDEIKRAVEKAKASNPHQQGDILLAPRRKAAALHPDGQQEDGKNVLVVDADHLRDGRIVAHNQEHPAVLSFDLLRTRILQHMRTKGFKTILVTSPTPGCGKSVTAINLAFSMARQLDLRTILLDLDLRKPQIARYLGIRPSRDIYSVLDGQHTITGALYSVDVAGPRLQIMPTLSTSRRPAETLASTEMRGLMEKLRDLHDDLIIIADMPPMLVFDDVISFLPLADAVLMAVAAGESTSRDVQDALRLIPEEKFAGVVMTKSGEKPDSGYYKYY